MDRPLARAGRPFEYRRSRHISGEASACPLIPEPSRHFPRENGGFVKRPAFFRQAADPFRAAVHGGARPKAPCYPHKTRASGLRFVPAIPSLSQILRGNYM